MSNVQICSQAPLILLFTAQCFSCQRIHVCVGGWRLKYTRASKEMSPFSPQSTASVEKAERQRLLVIKCGHLLKVAVTRDSLTWVIKPGLIWIRRLSCSPVVSRGTEKPGALMLAFEHLSYRSVIVRVSDNELYSFPRLPLRNDPTLSPANLIYISFAMFLFGLLTYFLMVTAFKRVR